jgi:hypothetical protein
VSLQQITIIPNLYFLISSLARKGVAIRGVGRPQKYTNFNIYAL